MPQVVGPRTFRLPTTFLFLALLSAAQPLPAAPRYDHVVVVVEENTSFDQIIGSPDAPYLNELAAHGALFTNFYALTHPSHPNYLHLFSGWNQGVTDSDVPSNVPLTTPNLGAALRAAGHSFAGYSQGLPEVGSLVTHAGAYVRRHVPWTHWQTESPPAGSHGLPPSVNRPFTDFPTDPADFDLLPTVSFVIPDQFHYMHDGPISVADTWLRDNLSAYRDWAVDNNSLLVVVWDEDNFFTDNRIPLILSGAHVRPGEISSRYTLHHLLQTLLEMYDLPPLGLTSRTGSLYGGFLGEDPRPATTRRFQQGSHGYTGAHDGELPADGIDPDLAFLPTVTVDNDGSRADGKAPSQALIRFDHLVGTAAQQIPPGAEILSAQLVLTTGSAQQGATSPDSFYLHRMLTAWDERSLWSEQHGPYGTDDRDAASVPDFWAEANVGHAPVIFSVTDTVQAWVRGEPNNGWLIETDSNNGWSFWSSEAEQFDLRPLLEVVYANLGIRGDFNSDGRIDVQDIDLLGRALRGLLDQPVFDLDVSGGIDAADWPIWVHDIKNTWFGDANLDGEFSSRDLVQVFQRGEYEDALPSNSGWADGDWNGDAEFNSRDFVAAFQDGGYERGARVPPAAVPEPTSMAYYWAGAAWLVRCLSGRRGARRASARGSTPPAFDSVNRSSHSDARQSHAAPPSA